MRVEQQQKPELAQLNYEDEETVEVRPVDTLEQLDERRVDLMKIDVEGFESEVLQGARRLLSDPRLKAIIIELNGLGRRFGRKDTDIDMLLAAAGFTACRYSPEARTLSPASLPVNSNVIYCRDTSFIEARLRTAEAFTAAQRKF